MSVNSRLSISVTRFSRADLNARGERLRIDDVLRSLTHPAPLHLFPRQIMTVSAVFHD